MPGRPLQLAGRRRWCSPVQAAGNGISRFQELSGINLAARVNSAPAGDLVSFPAGTHSFSDFNTLVQGVRVGAPISRRGIIGTSGTVLQMAASSSTRAADVPTAAGTTNPLYLAYFDADDLRLRCFTLQGTSQGHLYNGIRLHLVDRALIQNVTLLGAGPGNNYVPPGETFAFNAYGGDFQVYENCLSDGQGTGASGWGANGVGGTDGFRSYTYRRCAGTNHPYSAAFALWQGCGETSLIGCSANNNRTSLNLERMGQETFRGSSTAVCVMNVVDFTFGSVLTGGQDIFLGNDRGSGVLNIYDPIGRNASNKIRIFFPALEQGNPNIQKKTDVHVWVGGAWTGGTPGSGAYVGGTDVASTYVTYIGSGA